MTMLGLTAAMAWPDAFREVGVALAVAWFLGCVCKAVGGGYVRK